MKNTCNIIKCFKRSRRLFNVLLSHISPLIKSDRLYIKLKWSLNMNYPLNLKNPKTFNEKLQWLKLFDHNTDYVKMVDKLEAKKYVASIIGADYIIPTIGEWKTPTEIKWDSLPNKFVLKCTHDSGGVVICKNKKTFDKEAALKKLSKSLRTNYYWRNREWPYKNVQKRIIAEEYMEDEYGELRDYKFFCFNGKVKLMFIATDRTKTTDTCFDFFDAEFNHLPFIQGHPNAKQLPAKPKSFMKMKELAEKLAQNIAHLRVDFYEINGRIYFGELTFSHFSGMVPFVPEEWDYKFGSWIQLPKIKNN